MSGRVAFNALLGRRRALARHLWAMLLARIHEALPPSCPSLPQSDSNHRLHRRCPQHENFLRPHQRIDPAIANLPSALARVAAGGSGCGTGLQRSSVQLLEVMYALGQLAE